MNKIELVENLMIYIVCAFALSLVINAWKIASEDEMIFSKLYRWLDSKFRNNKANKKYSKFRNSGGLLYIAKPLYHCPSCMPSVWVLPFLFIFNPLETFIISVFAVYISTYLYNKIN